ncbi:MAG: hypothetical protein ACODAQ_08175, partial [Phycisphaeraceae bacterium]
MTTRSSTPVAPTQPAPPPAHDSAPVRRRGIGVALRRFVNAWGLHVVLTAASFVFVLPFVWMVMTSLKPLEQVGVGSWVPQPRSELKPADIADAPGLMAQLAADTPLGAHLRRDFDEPLRRQLRQWSPDVAPDPALLAKVRRQLNARITADASLYDPQAFTAVELERAPEALLQPDVQLGGYERARLNRLLLEDALDGAIRAAPRFQWWNYAAVFEAIPFA